MIFRIMCKNKERTDAYADLLERCELLANGRVFCVSVDGGCYFADRSEIMINPSIKHQSNRNIYKINLDGYGLSETIRAGKDEKK